MTWLFDLLPWWVWFVCIGGLILAGFLTLRAFGIPLGIALSTASAVAVAIFSAVIYSKGVSAERSRQKRRDEKAVKDARVIDDKVNARSADENRERLKQWKDR